MSGVHPARRQDLLHRARRGDTAALGLLIHQYRPYLKMLARLGLDARLKTKLDDSDLVQEVSALVVRDFASFRGESEAELTAWLRTVMARITSKSRRHYSRQRRAVQMEIELKRSLDHTSELLSRSLVCPDALPSEQVLEQERSVLVAHALDALSADYREVILLRDFQGLSIEQIADRMDRSPAAVRKLWARAIIKVRELMRAKL